MTGRSTQLWTPFSHPFFLWAPLVIKIMASTHHRLHPPIIDVDYNINRHWPIRFHPQKWGPASQARSSKSLQWINPNSCLHMTSFQSPLTKLIDFPNIIIRPSRSSRIGVALVYSFSEALSPYMDPNIVEAQTQMLKTQGSQTPQV